MTLSGSTLPDLEKIQGRWEPCTENLHGRDRRMIDAFEDDSYEEELEILESKEVRATLKVLGRNKSPRGRWDTNRIISIHRD